MSIWSTFYKNRVGNGYANYCRERYKPFINVITNNINVKNMREEGCGIATISKIIMQRVNINLSMFDIDPDQVELSRENINSNSPYIGSIFEKQGKTDLIFSHGVLEHFSDHDIRNILNRQKEEANIVIHYVPTNMYKTPSFGDERLMSVESWVNKFNPEYHFAFNNGHDLVLIF